MFFNSAMNLLFLTFYCSLLSGLYAQYVAQQQLGTNYNIGDQSRQEVIDGNGDIRGQYSFVDPSGKTVIVRYTAGKNGFQVENNQPFIISTPASSPLSRQAQVFPITRTQPQVFPQTRPQLQLQSQPQPPVAQVIKPEIVYRGLQLTRPKYQGQILFRPAALSSISPASSRQLEAYQNALRDQVDDLQQLDITTPAQFPIQTDNGPAIFQQQNVRFLPQQQQSAQLVYQPTTVTSAIAQQSELSDPNQPSIQYNLRPQFETTRPDLRVIAQNPVPPEYRFAIQLRQIPRDATPITEEQDDIPPQEAAAINNNVLFNNNYRFQ